tara:strand:+ start:10525 stop:10752 length:228 start_codon:yes stop_codon:yes gene_type:complete
MGIKVVINFKSVPYKLNKFIGDDALIPYYAVLCVVLRLYNSRKFRKLEAVNGALHLYEASPAMNPKYSSSISSNM